MEQWEIKTHIYLNKVHHGTFSKLELVHFYGNVMNYITLCFIKSFESIYNLLNCLITICSPFSLLPASFDQTLLVPVFWLVLSLLVRSTEKIIIVNSYQQNSTDIK